MQKRRGGVVFSGGVDTPMHTMITISEANKGAALEVRLIWNGWLICKLFKKKNLYGIGKVQLTYDWKDTIKQEEHLQSSLKFQ